MKGIFTPLERPKAIFRLFCFPYAGGSSRTYLDWQNYLPQEIELVCIDPPGRGERINENPIYNLSELVKQLAVEILPWLDRPFGFFGHSNGALIVFELARHFQSLGVKIELVIVSAKAAPSQIQSDKLYHQLPEDEFIATLRESGATPEEFFDTPELLELFMPLLRADYALSETYIYQNNKVINADLLLLSGTEDINCMDVDDRNAWAKEFNGHTRWLEIPGGHFYIDYSPEIVVRAVVSEIMRICRKRQTN